MRTLRFDELPSLIGKEIGVSDWFTIDQARIDAFAEATLDRQWIHIDVERATREIGGPIAHGFLTLSLLPHLTKGLVEVEGVARGINYGLNGVRFLSPVPAGARVRVRVKVIAVEPKAGGVALTRDCSVEIEGAERPALVAQTIGLIIPEAAPPAAAG